MINSKLKVKVAIADDFLVSFSRVPRNLQAKVMNFITKFRANPHLSGINYEKISKAKDPNMRSVRIDDDYRGIVLKPESGNVYVLLWVDSHDRAYQWAENKRYLIHPETGSIQVIDIEETEVKQKEYEAKAEQAEHGLFAHISDRHLLKVGIPAVQLPLIRSVTTSEALDKIADQIPQEAYEALFFLSEGYSLEDVLRELETGEKAETIDTNDYESALDKPDSRRRFYVVDDELELAAILNAPLEKWRIFLHPSQRKIVEKDWNGPALILGGAGAGKTVVAMHRAKWLVQNVYPHAQDSILFTTFTRNLAVDIQDNLNKICSKELMRRIEVVNLDKWVAGFLQKHGYDFTIDYGNISEQLWRKAFDRASAESGLDLTFYQEEWKRVIQPQGITAYEQYQKASRLGRGIKLNRKMRRLVWRVFEEYRILMNERGLREADDAMRDAGFLLEQNKEVLPYRAVIVDEAQDFSRQAFMLIRRMVPEGRNDIFIVGDAHQRIYRHKVVLGHCGIQIRGRSKKLKINYRTTDETRKWAVELLKEVNIDDLDGGTDDQMGYKSLMHGVMPEVRNFASFQQEIDYILKYLESVKHETGSVKEVCLVARTNILLKQYESAINNNGIDTCVIKRSQPEDRRMDGVRLATMHRVKGLEFDRMIIAGVNDSVIPYEGKEPASSDLVIQKESEVQERALLYVAATRAKKEVKVTSYGKPSRLLGCYLPAG